MLGVHGDVHAAVAFSHVTVRIFEGSNLFPALHFPRTDAAKCDTHFYILFQLGNNSLEDLVIGVIDTVYTGFDFRTYLFICSRRGGHCLVGINGTNRPAVTLYYLFICSGHLCLRRERGRPVELYNACSVDIGGGRSQEGDRAGGTPASLQMHSLFI